MIYVLISNQLEVIYIDKHKLLTKDKLKAIFDKCKEGEQIECFIILNGNCRSSKTIMKEDKGNLTLHNEIDGTVNDYNSLNDMIKDKDINNISKALKQNVLYLYNYETERFKDIFKNIDKGKQKKAWYVNIESFIVETETLEEAEKVVNTMLKNNEVEISSTEECFEDLNKCEVIRNGERC